MGLENVDIVVEDFKQKLKDIKEYIINLLKRKKESKIQETKKELTQALEAPKQSNSWWKKMLDKSKSMIFGEEENPSKSSSSCGESNPYEAHHEDQDEYIPKDSEFGESLGEQPRFAEIYPGLKGYYTSGKKSYFDPNTNLWSKKKVLSDFGLMPNTQKSKFTYAGMIVSGVVSIPLPEGSLPDSTSLKYTGKNAPFFQIDQNNCLYLVSNEKQYVSFDFYTGQNLPIIQPIPKDSEKIIFDELSSSTKNLLSRFNGTVDISTAQAIKRHIITTKKYSTKIQGTLRENSDSENYITNLDRSDVLECFSANALFVALCREIGLSARLVVGHMVQSLDKNGKGLLGSNNGHAWSEVWDSKNGTWIQIDSTPIIKEDGEKSNQNMGEGSEGDSGEGSGEGGNSQGGQSGSDSSSGGGQSGKQDSGKSDKGSSQGSGEGKDGKSQGGEGEKDGNQGGSAQGDQSGSSSSSGGGQSGNQSSGSKSSGEMLDELVKKAKDDNFANQGDQMTKVIEKLENADTKEEIKEILDSCELTDFAKEAIDKIGNEEILKQEISQINKVEDEKQLDRALNNSLLNDEFKEKLKEYAKAIKKKLEEERKKSESEMQRMGFTKQEIGLYKLYKKLEDDVKGEVVKQIKALEKILPPNFKIVSNERDYFTSGSKLGGTGKLIEFQLTGDQKIFRRDEEVNNLTEINMFETIIIDRSGSMGNFSDTNSPLREAVKAAIIRAKVLEHFKVNFSIIIFDTDMEEVMEFGETFTDRRKNTVPARLMRAVMKNGGTDIGRPLSYTLESMKKYSKLNGVKSFGNISFLGDGEPTDGLQGNGLKALIEQIRRAGFGLTAYYINGSNQHMRGLEGYFGSEESGGTIIVQNIEDLTSKLIGAYNENLRRIIKKYTKK